MLEPFLVPILILTLGAVVLSVVGANIRRISVRLRIRGLCLIAAGIAGLALLTLLWGGRLLPMEWVGSAWRPLALFGAPLTLGADEGSWSLAVVMVASTFLALLASCTSVEELRPAKVALILTGTGVGVAALFATSFVALIVAWGLTDVLLAAMLLQYGQKGTHRAGLALLSGILATGALWAAPLMTQAEGISGFLELAHFSGRSASVLQIAVILRLGLVPLHLWRPIDLETKAAQLIPLVVIPTLLGFDLLTYLPALTAGLPSILFVMAAVTVLVGGFVAWSETEERLSLAGIIVAETGLAVLAVANAGQQAVAVAIAAAIAWALGVTVFSLTPGWSGRYFWRGLPSLLALLSLLGLPATLGFVARFITYSGLEADLLVLAVALIGETFVVAALLRLWFWAESRPLPRNRWVEPVYLVFFVLAAIALVLTGLSPDAFAGRGQGADVALPSLGDLIQQNFGELGPTGGIASWAGWALPLVAGVTLFLAGEGLRQRLEVGWRGLSALLRLEWIYGLFYLAMGQMARLLRGTSEVVEGEGALLWTAVFLLIVLLYLTSSGGP